MGFQFRLPANYPQTSGAELGFRLDGVDDNSRNSNAKIRAVLVFSGSGPPGELQPDVDALVLQPLVDEARRLGNRSPERRKVSAARDRLAEAQKGVQVLQAAIRTTEARGEDPAVLQGQDPGAQLATIDAQTAALRKRLPATEGAVSKCQREVQVAEATLRDNAVSQLEGMVGKLWNQMEIRRRAALVALQEVATGKRAIEPGRDLVTEAAVAELAMAAVFGTNKQQILVRVRAELEKATAAPEETEVSGV